VRIVVRGPCRANPLYRLKNQPSGRQDHPHSCPESRIPDRRAPPGRACVPRARRRSRGRRCTRRYRASDPVPGEGTGFLPPRWGLDCTRRRAGRLPVAWAPGSAEDGPVDDGQEPPDFALLGGVSVSYPQDGLFIEFTQFREDTIGNLFAQVTVNGKSMGEIHLVIAIGAHFAPSPDRTQFIITAKLQVSAALAQAVNTLFNTTVLTPNEQIATEDLIADVLNF